MNQLLKSIVGKKLVLLLGVVFCLTMIAVGATADAINEDDVLEAATEAVEAGVSEDFVESAIDEARTAGLADGDIEEMLEDLKEAFEDGADQDKLNAIVDEHLAGRDFDNDDDGDEPEEDEPEDDTPEDD